MSKYSFDESKFHDCIGCEHHKELIGKIDAAVKKAVREALEKVSIHYEHPDGSWNECATIVNARINAALGEVERG